MLIDVLKQQPQGTILMIDPEQLLTAIDRLCDKVKEDTLLQLQEQSHNADLLTKKEVKAMLKKSPNTLWKWAKKGYLVPVRVGGTLMYKRSDVVKIMGGK